MAEPQGTPTPPAPETPPAPAAVAPGAVATPTIDELRQQAAAEFAAGLKAATGFSTLSEMKAAHEKAAADKLAEQGEFKQLAEQAQARLAAVERDYQAERIRGALLAASTDSIDPEVVLALLGSAATVAPDGSVSVNGKPPAQAVAELLKAKPHLARPVGGQGSGAGGAGSGAPEAAGMTMAQLATVRESNPAAYHAEILRRAALPKGSK